MVFDGAAFTSCVAALDGACGAPARAALFDSTCFGFAPPAGGDAQRRMVHRVAGVGAGCAPVRDGVGAAFFGTCDPTAALLLLRRPRALGLGCTVPVQRRRQLRRGARRSPLRARSSAWPCCRSGRHQHAAGAKLPIHLLASLDSPTRHICQRLSFQQFNGRQQNHYDKQPGCREQDSAHDHRTFRVGAVTSAQTFLNYKHGQVDAACRISRGDRRQVFRRIISGHRASAGVSHADRAGPR